ADFSAGLLHHTAQLRAYRIAKPDVSNKAIAEERIDAVPRAVEELIRNHELQRRVLFLQRPDGRQRNDALHSELLKAVDIRPEIQFAGKQAVSSAMPCEERYFAPVKISKNIRIRGLTKWRLLAEFLRIRQPRDGIQTAAANDADLGLRQSSSR